VVDLEGKWLSSAREFVEFWLEVSVHPGEPITVPAGTDDLVSRLVFAAQDQGISRETLEAEFGDLHKLVIFCISGAA
jgi:hypothetical protein